MATKAVEIVNLARLQEKLAALPGAYKRAARLEVKRSLLNVQNGAKRRVSVDRGRLRNSITHEVEADGLSGLAGTNQSPVGAVNEFGSRPHFPPLKEIRAWAVRHGMDPGAAYPIALKIARQGTAARPFLFPAFEEERPRFRNRLAKALEKAGRDTAAGR